MESNLTILLCYPRSRGGLADQLVRQLDLVHLAARTPGEHCLLLEDEDLAPICPAPRPDLALLLVSEANVSRAYTLADELRASRVPTALAGPYVQAHPDEAAPHADAVVSGPTDLLWPRLLADFQTGRLALHYAGGLATDRLGLPRRGALLVAG